MDNLKAVLFRYRKYILLCCLLICINILFVCLGHRQVGDKFIITAITIPILIGLFILTLWLKEKKQYAVHKLFLIFASTLGFLYVFLTPIGGAPDEPAHFRRAYEVSQGHIISEHAENGSGGNTLPDSINVLFGFNFREGSYSEAAHIIKESTQTGEVSFQVFGGASLYSPVPYLPQAIGILIGKILHLPMFILVYLARIFNLVFWIIVIYFAIKYLPIGKAAFSLLLLSPISLQSVSSCQADAVTNAAVIGLIAFVLYKIKNPTKLSRTDKAIAIILSIIIALCKIVYLPVCLLLWLLPSKCFSSKKTKIIQLITLTVCVAIINLAWFAISFGYLVEFTPGVDSMAQVQYVFSHPFQYILTVFYTYASNGLTYLLQAFGSNLGWFTIGLSNIYILFYILFFIYTYLVEDKKQFSLTVFQKTFFAIIFTIIFLLISSSLYVQWTAVGADHIGGLQGRYFIPIIPLLLLLIVPIATKKYHKESLTYVFPIVAAINCYALTTIMLFYII